MSEFWGIDDLMISASLRWALDRQAWTLAESALIRRMGPMVGKWKVY